MPQFSNLEPIDLAHEASLRYVTDSQPGLSRQKHYSNFNYYDLAGKKIVDPQVLNRIEQLKIPPAWVDVWICASQNGHLQATGRDEKSRKQYIYHNRWSEISNLTKFDKMIYLSAVLPNIRSKIASDMNLTGLKQEKILATIVWLLDHTYIRIGNEEYAKENEHFGLTTLRNRHVEIKNSLVVFEFTGKSGKKHQVGITHPKVIKTIKKLEELPGYELFQYLDENDQKHPVDSQEVNDYLKQIAKESVTAKDFRTWGGTVLTGVNLTKIGNFITTKQLKDNLKAAVSIVAKHLGNTPKVCQSYYIHPTVVQTYEKKILIPHFKTITKSMVRGLDKQEYATSILLKKYS